MMNTMGGEEDIPDLDGGAEDVSIPFPPFNLIFMLILRNIMIIY